MGKCVNCTFAYHQKSFNICVFCKHWPTIGGRRKVKLTNFGINNQDPSIILKVCQVYLIKPHRLLSRIIYTCKVPSLRKLKFVASVQKCLCNHNKQITSYILIPRFASPVLHLLRSCIFFKFL